MNERTYVYTSMRPCAGHKWDYEKDMYAKRRVCRICGLVQYQYGTTKGDRTWWE